jgi:U3 small nucleolar RNA-associated protein 23
VTIIMKIKRQKKAQRILTFYRNHFGFRAPYHVVLDGTFCQKALNNKINLREQIPKYFGDEVKLLTTACILTELERLGKKCK